MKKKKNLGMVIVLASILLFISVMDMLLVTRMTTSQTRQSGIYQLENISNELEGTISNAKILTMNLAAQASNYLDNKDALEAFIIENKQSLRDDEDNCCYNLYIAGTGWDIIPDLDKPEGFVATERNWYTGAVENDGTPYVTAPYVDAWTGNICYTVSVELGDKDTVIGVDYTLDSVQEYISQMQEIGSQDAVICTEDGIIVGYADESLISTDLNDSLPNYTAVFTMVKNEQGLVSAKAHDGWKTSTLFATKCASDWYLIVAENNWEMYKNSYIQLMATILLSVLLFGVIIALYLVSRRNQERAEKALSSKEEFLNNISSDLRKPLKKIIDKTDKNSPSFSGDYEENLTDIHNAGNQLSDMIEQIISYSSIVRNEKSVKKTREKAVKNKKLSSRYQTAIISVILVVMVLSVYANISATSQNGKTTLTNEVNSYDDRLSEWINTQKSILDMFCSNISVNPEILDDYDAAVEYLNDITVQYPEISVTYMTNPKVEHTVIMNNGWQPDADWHVEERQWYIDTMASEDGWSISTPYYDEQTGIYCVTISERVYDAETGEFLGNFGIDFYMDKLIEILGASYTDTSYAFLADAQGEIINHPYGTYQMSEENITNVSDLSYAGVPDNGKSVAIVKDYDGKYKTIMAKENETSYFTVYVVESVWSIFGKVFIISFLEIIGFGACIFVVYSLMKRLTHWQDEVNEQLQIAADTAISAGNAKSQFLAQMSHEIRTPINAVLGMNEMITREATSESIKEYSQNIRSAGRTLLSLINSILDFSKIEDGKMEIIPVGYETAVMVKDLENSISERAKRKGLNFKFVIDETIPAKLFGDDVRVKQVISNLLTNAVKYTEKGSVTLIMKNMNGEKNADTGSDSSAEKGAEGDNSVATEKGAAEKGTAEKGAAGDILHLYVEVRDTGIGIKDEDREKLFESFQRLEEKRNRNIEGTGLGISIVTKLLNMMGSKLSVDSVYGEGSSFYFEIDQKIVDPSPMGDFEESFIKEEAEAEKSDEKIILADNANVLIVDDNEMNIMVAKGLMKRNHVYPDTVNSGREAIEKVKEKNYDIIFLDHMMPQMDGIETLEKMRAEKLLPENTKVIALTANAIVGAREMYLQKGFDSYLSKPIEVKEMEKRLEQYLPAEKISYVSASQNTENAGNISGTANAESAGNNSGAANAEGAGNNSGAANAESVGNSFGAGNAASVGNNSGVGNAASAATAGNKSNAGSAGNVSGETGVENPEDFFTMSELLKLRELCPDINVLKGLTYCMDSKEFYMSVVNEYIKNEKTVLLVECYANEDWKNYGIYAHALKSSSKTLGAMEFSEHAREAEFAAKADNIEFLQNNYQSFIKEYREILRQFRQMAEMLK